MTATKLFINTVSLGFTPTGGSLSSLTKITQTAIDGGVQNVTFKGDGDLFNTFEGNVAQVPTVTIQGGNVGALLASAAGVVGSLAFIWPDAKNGSGAGSFALSWVLSNAILSAKSAQAPHAQLASGSNVFSSFSSDGTTNPLAVTVL